MDHNLTVESLDPANQLPNVNKRKKKLDDLSMCTCYKVFVAHPKRTKHPVLMALYIQSKGLEMTLLLKKARNFKLPRALKRGQRKAA